MRFFLALLGVARAYANLAALSPQLMALFDKTLQTNGRLESWYPATVRKFIAAAGLSSQCTFANVTGTDLLAICRDCADLASYNIKQDKDLKKWAELWDVMNSKYTLTGGAMSAGSGAEDLDLWTIMEKNAAFSHTFLATLSRSPHLAMGFLRFYTGSAIDAVM